MRLIHSQLPPRLQPGRVAHSLHSVLGSPKQAGLQPPTTQADKIMVKTELFQFHNLYSIHSKLDPAKAVKYSGGRAPLVLDTYIQEPAFYFKVQVLASGVALIYKDDVNEMVQWDRDNKKLMTSPYDPEDDRQMWIIQPDYENDLNNGCVIRCAYPGHTGQVWDSKESGTVNSEVLSYQFHGNSNQRWELRKVIGD